MLDFSFQVAPNTEKLRAKLNAPFSAIISPAAKSEIPFIDVSFEQFPRCPKCKAYISNYCEKTENEWTCVICGTKNKEAICDFLPEGNDVECRVDDKIGTPVLALYIDLGFHPNDIKAMIPSIIAFLKSLEDTNIIVLLGVQASECSVLCPHHSFFQMNEKSLVLKKDDNYDVTASNKLPAPIANFTTFPDDLSKFVFSPK